MDSRHKCGYCSMTFGRKEHALEHETTHLEQGPQHCELCCIPFYDPLELQTHIRQHHASEAFKCDICGGLFGSGSMLARHMPVHTKNGRVSSRSAFRDACNDNNINNNNTSSSNNNRGRPRRPRAVRSRPLSRRGRVQRPPRDPSPLEVLNQCKIEIEEEPEDSIYTCPMCAMVLPSKDIYYTHFQQHYMFFTPSNF